MINRKKKFHKILIDITITLSTFAVCTGICYLLDYFKLKDLNFIIIYVLGVLTTALLTRGYVYSSVLSLLSVLGYNFFFTTPRYSLQFNDKMYLVTFVLMFAVSIITSTIMFKFKKRMSQVIMLNKEKEKLNSASEKDQLKVTLLRSISHDLRTPLTTIKNGAEILLENDTISDADRDEVLADITIKADWTIRLVENLLALSRIDSAELTVKKEKEALEEILPQAVRNMQGVLGNRKITYYMPENLLLVPMDATLIMQAVGNIVNNAIKHTEDDGNIWIQVWDTAENAVFRISNDGKAIADTDLPHIFDMYYTTIDRNNESGFGIGLAVCKLIITAHGGQISARNTDEGKVVFEFTLPMEK